MISSVSLYVKRIRRFELANTVVDMVLEDVTEQYVQAQRPCPAAPNKLTVTTLALRQSYRRSYSTGTTSAWYDGGFNARPVVC